MLGDRKIYVGPAAAACAFVAEANITIGDSTVTFKTALGFIQHRVYLYYGAGTA